MNTKKVVGYFSNKNKEDSTPCDLFLVRKNANGVLYAELPFMKKFMSFSKEEYDDWLNGYILDNVTELSKEEFEVILHNK